MDSSFTQQAKLSYENKSTISTFITCTCLRICKGIWGIMTQTWQVLEINCPFFVSLFQRETEIHHQIHHFKNIIWKLLLTSLHSLCIMYLCFMLLSHPTLCFNLTSPFLVLCDLIQLCLSPQLSLPFQIACLCIYSQSVCSHFSTCFPALVCF